MFNCELCEFNTNYQSTYNEHLRSTTHFLNTGKRLKDFRYECIPCNFKTYYNSKYAEHCATKNHLIRVNNYSPEKYNCNICNYWTYSKGAYNAHSFRHRKNKDYRKVDKKEKDVEKVDDFQYIDDSDLLKTKISEEIVRLYEKGKNPNNFFKYSYYARKNLDLTTQELNNFLWELRKII